MCLHVRLNISCEIGDEVRFDKFLFRLTHIYPSQLFPLLGIEKTNLILFAL